MYIQFRGSGRLDIYLMTSQLPRRLAGGGGGGDWLQSPATSRPTEPSPHVRPTRRRHGVSVLLHCPHWPLKGSGPELPAARNRSRVVTISSPGGCGGRFGVTPVRFQKAENQDKPLGRGRPDLPPSHGGTLSFRLRPPNATQKQPWGSSPPCHGQGLPKSLF